MKKGSIALTAGALAFMTGCATTSFEPPNWVYEAWSKDGVATERVKAEMRDCGYNDVNSANDLSKAEASQAEACMKAKGFELDLSSYRPHNCYGNAPYLCKRLWGGQAPQAVEVKPSTD
ncbi:MAG: hypothetical protein ACOCY2_02165 [Guyparkeria sp.]|uniref:hypothetical protein n=1 Tax=Guyparkeria sp. TaxID=2035736 RepID=UPI00397CDFE4